MKQECLCIFGEVLFDHFPDGSRVLGGAPFNVAWHLRAFGQQPCFISRVGTDAEGGEVLAAMRDWGMDARSLQQDAHYATGRVSVSLKDGEPEYDIVAPVAYDAIDPAPLASMHCGLLYHGSLALRHERSRQALRALKARSPEIVFVDVNLRTPWWRKEAVLAAIAGAHWVKLNQGELDLLCTAAGAGQDKAAAFIRENDLQGVVVTRGEHGAMAVTAAGACHEVRPAGSSAVVDTVGAGDAFASVMILGLSHGWPLEQTLERAQAFASGLVGNRGATVSDRGFYQGFLDEWNLKA